MRSSPGERLRPRGGGLVSAGVRGEAVPGLLVRAPVSEAGGVKAAIVIVLIALFLLDMAGRRGR